MEENKTFPSWTAYTGLEIVEQKFPDILIGKYRGRTTEFRDLSAFYHTNLLGFQNKDILPTENDLLYSSVSFGMTDRRRELYASKLLDICNMKGGKVIPSCSGSAAVDHALRAAWQYHARKGNRSKKKIISLERSYHGTTAICLGAGHYPFGPDDENITGLYVPSEIKGLFLHMESPRDSASITNLSDLLDQNDDIAALVYEPVQSAGATTPFSCFKGLADLARKHDVLLIADEIATFARLGTWTASEFFGIKPDIVTLGKGLSNGIAPIAATVMSPEVYERLETYDKGTKDFGETLAWTPLLTSIGLNVLDIVSQGNLLKNGTEHGKEIRDKMKQSLAGLPIQVEGIGGISRLNFGDIFTAHHMILQMMDKGYFSYSTQGFIYIESPLIGSSVDYSELGNVVRESFERIQGRLERVERLKQK